MNYKVLSLCLGLVVFVLIGAYLFNNLFMKSSFQHSSYESLVFAQSESWLPIYIPSSAINIEEHQNHDSGDLRATFEYDVNDTSSVEKACVKVLKQAELTKYVCPPYESRTSTIILSANGQAVFISYASTI